MPSTTITTTTTTTRSVSLYHRKSLFGHSHGLKKKTRPSTWTTTCHRRRYTISPRVSRWVSQHNNQQQQIRASRLTMATISSLTTSTNDSDTIVAIPTTSTTTTTTGHPHRPYYHNTERPIFHTQSLLFLFGFLYFPCWWIGGYYLKVVVVVKEDVVEEEIADLERRPVHSSLLANGKTTSRHLLYYWPPQVQNGEMDDRLLFYHWNRCMSLVSIVLLILETSLIIWYYVAY